MSRAGDEAGMLGGATARRRSLSRSRAVAGVVATVAIVGGLTLALVGLQGPSTTAVPPAPLPQHPFTTPQGQAVVPAVPMVPPARQAADTVVIPSLGVTAPFTAEGVSAGQLGIPSDDHVVGLYAGGGTPQGTTGTVLLAGHVNYAHQGTGALGDLAAIKMGAVIYTADGTGAISAWIATSLVAVPKSQLPQDIFTAAGPRRLVVVTCGGAFDPGTGHYVDNVIVTAVPAVVGTGVSQELTTSPATPAVPDTTQGEST